MSKEDDDKKREQMKIIKGVIDNLDNPEFLAALELVRNAKSTTHRPDQEVAYVENRKRPSSQREEDSLPKPKVKVEEIEEDGKQEKINNQLNTGKLTQNSQQEGLQPIQKEVQKDTPITTQNVQEQQPPERQPVITERPRTQSEETQTEIGENDNTPVEVTEFKFSKEEEEKERKELDTQFKGEMHTGMRSLKDFTIQAIEEGRQTARYIKQRDIDLEKRFRGVENSISQSNSTDSSYRVGCALFEEYDRQYLNTNIGQQISAVQSNQVIIDQRLNSIILQGFNKIAGAMTQFDNRLQTIESNQNVINNNLIQIGGTVNTMNTKLDDIIKMQTAFGNAAINLQIGNVAAAKRALGLVTDMEIEHQYYIPEKLRMEIEDTYEKREQNQEQSPDVIYKENLLNLMNIIRQELIVNEFIPNRDLLNKLIQNKNVRTIMNTLLELNSKLNTDADTQEKFFGEIVDSVRNEIKQTRAKEMAMEETRETQNNLNRLNAIGILETYYNYLINNNIVQSPEEYKMNAIRFGSALPLSFNENINTGDINGNTITLNGTLIDTRGKGVLRIMQEMFEARIGTRAEAAKANMVVEKKSKRKKKNILVGKEFKNNP